MGERKEIAFFDVDTQFDFMDPDGKLYVEGAERLVPNIKRLIDHAHAKDIPIISSADAHTRHDPEFEQFPPHCVKGEPGQERIPATQVEGAVVVPAGKGKVSIACAPQMILEKQTLDVFSNPNTEAVLTELGAEKFYVFGVATDYCVRTAVLGLRDRGYSVVVVTDAIRGISKENAEKALEEMKTRGARFTTTEEVLKET